MSIAIRPERREVVDPRVVEAFKANFSSKESKKIEAYASKLFNGRKLYTDFQVCDAVITKFKDNKKFKQQVAAFDFRVGLLKLKNQQPGYSAEARVHLVPQNIDRLRKWIAYGFDLQIYQRHPAFVNFMFHAALVSQMKVTRQCTLREVEGEPALLVEGRWMKGSDVMREFEVRFDPDYRETFLFKRSSGEVYTYTDTGEGLVPFHPYKEGMSKPISKLDADDYARVLDKACTFVRPGEEALSDEERTRLNRGRTCVLQVVSSRVEDKGGGLLTKNMHKVFSSKHPWVRLVEPCSTGANVFEGGFNWEQRPEKKLAVTTGRFRSLDLFEYKPAKRYVTNIAITPEELQALRRLAEEHVPGQNSPAFHFLYQNCTVAVRHLADKGMGLHIPTEIDVLQLMLRLTPDFFQSSVHLLQGIHRAAQYVGSRVAPRPIRKATVFFKSALVRLIEGTVAFRLALLSLAFGSAKITAGGCTFGDCQRSFAPKARQLRFWHDLSQHRYNLPYLIQEWQERQPSTVVYSKEHTKFCIVPH